MRLLTIALSIVPVLASCGGPPRSLGLIYLNGRAVAPFGDSLVGMTTQGVAGLITYNHYTETFDTVGTEALHQPLHVESNDGRWYVSDLQDGRPAIVVLDRSGALAGRFELDHLEAVTHQFGVLSDGRIVVQVPNGRLVVIGGDSLSTFALVEVGFRGSLLAGAGGGILHAIPDRHLTLYNEFGNIRWRVEWPWAETAFFTDISVDRNGRIHLVAGVPRDRTFVVYTIGRTDGEVVRWSQPGPYATFTVERNGGLRPDSADRWLQQ